MKAPQPMKPDSDPERQRQRSTAKKTGKTIHGDSIEAEMREAFAAGWNAFLAAHIHKQLQPSQRGATRHLAHLDF